MANFEIVKSTVGNGWEVSEVTAGGAVSIGDPVVVAAGGYFDRVADSPAKVDAISLSDATAEGDTISVVWWTPNIIVRGTMGTIAHVGDLVEIKVAAANAMTFEEETENVQGRIVNIYDATNKIVDVMPYIRYVS